MSEKTLNNILDNSHKKNIGESSNQNNILQNKYDYIKLLEDNFPKDFFSRVENFTPEHQQKMYEYLQDIVRTLGVDFFKGLDEIKLEDFGEEEDTGATLGRFMPGEVSLNSRYFGKDATEIFKNYFTITLLHELAHFKYEEDSVLKAKVEKFYNSNKKFIKEYYGEGTEEAETPDGFYAESWGLFRIGELDKKINDKENIIYNFIKEINESQSRKK